ncbi:hypothetical protein V5H41_29905, partial [Salmonella enterica]
PRDFSADATSTSMRAVNSTDTEGDLFSDPPTIAWPRDFSADATSTSMRAVNSTDTEGDLFSDPPTIA